MAMVLRRAVGQGPGATPARTAPGPRPAPGSPRGRAPARQPPLPPPSRSCGTRGCPDASAGSAAAPPVPAEGAPGSRGRRAWRARSDHAGTTGAWSPESPCATQRVRDPGEGGREEKAPSSPYREASGRAAAALRSRSGNQWRPPEPGAARGGGARGGHTPEGPPPNPQAGRSPRPCPRPGFASEGSGAGSDFSPPRGPTRKTGASPTETSPGRGFTLCSHPELGSLSSRSGTHQPRSFLPVKPRFPLPSPR